MTYIPRICNVTKMTFIRYRTEVIGFEMVTFKDTRYLFLTKKKPRHESFTNHSLFERYSWD